jgi:hypothetical protein
MTSRRWWCVGARDVPPCNLKPSDLKTQVPPPNTSAADRSISSTKPPAGGLTRGTHL